MEDGGKDEAFLTGTESRPKIANWSTKDYPIADLQGFYASTRRWKPFGHDFFATPPPELRIPDEEIYKN